MPIVSFRVDRETYEALKKKASEEGMSVSELLRLMVREYLGIKMRNDLERRIEELERRITELEKTVKQQNLGLERYIRRG